MDELCSHACSGVLFTMHGLDQELSDTSRREISSASDRLETIELISPRAIPPSYHPVFYYVAWSWKHHSVMHDFFFFFYKNVSLILYLLINHETDVIFASQ